MSPEAPDQLYDDFPDAPSLTEDQSSPIYPAVNPPTSSSHFSPFSPELEKPILPIVHDPYEGEPFRYPQLRNGEDSRMDTTMDFAQTSQPPFLDTPHSFAYSSQAYPARVPSPRLSPRMSSTPTPALMQRTAGLTRPLVGYNNPQFSGLAPPLRGNSAWAPNQDPIAVHSPTSPQTWAPPGPNAARPHDSWSGLPVGNSRPANSLSNVEAEWSILPNTVLPTPARRRHSASTSRYSHSSQLARGMPGTSRVSPSNTGPSRSRASIRGVPQHSAPVRGSLKGKVRETEPSMSTERKAYHPKAPSGGSDWVMWVGNVPNDATQEEADVFFNDMSFRALRASTSSFRTIPSASTEDEDTGIESIFLILQSHCAFVNYRSEAHLQRALLHFNGRPFRPSPSPIKLICRPRRKAEEIKSGVGGQRGLGLHRKWVEQHILGPLAASVSPREETAPQPEGNTAVTTSQAARSAHYHAALDRFTEHLSQPPPGQQSESARSSPSISTTSTLLATYFPARYFVLKAMSKNDLQLSTELGLWATQSHNEFVLDQAFRTSKDVYLFFGANKSGEFHGYARMESQILIPAETSFELPSRNTTASQLEMSAFETHLRKWDSKLGHAVATDPGASVELTSALDAFQEEEEHSQPDPSSTYRPLGAPLSNPSLAAHSASPLLPLGSSTPSSLSPSTTKVGSSGSGSGAPSLGVTARSDSKPQDSPTSSFLPPSSGEGGSGGVGSGKGSSQNDSGTQNHWGTPFRVRWFAVQGLSFTSTRMLRNPWNRDREVKVSRDGTELEPSVGRALLELWDGNGPSSDGASPVSSNWPKV